MMRTLINAILYYVSTELIPFKIPETWSLVPFSTQNFLPVSAIKAHMFVSHCELSSHRLLVANRHFTSETTNYNL